MNEINAIARKMIQEAMRIKAPLLSFLGVVALLIYFPFSLHGDGTTIGKIKLLFLYSSMLLFALLSIQTVYLATLSFSKELKHKQFFLIDVKPIPRWKFFVGKLWGLAILNFILLIVLGFVTITSIFLFGTNDEKEARKLSEQLYVASASADLYFPEQAFEQDVDNRYKKKLAEGKIEFGVTEQEAKNKIRRDVREALQYVAVGQTKLFVFQNIPRHIRKNSDNKVRIRYKIHSPSPVFGFRVTTRWIIGQHTKYSTTPKAELGKFNEIAVPVNAIDTKGNLYLYYENRDAKAGTLYFPIEDGIEVLYPQGSFITNYIKFLLLMFLVLNLLAMISLFFATFLSFPVAILTSLFIFLVGILFDFLRLMAVRGADLLADERQSFLSFLYDQYFYILEILIPNFSQYLAFEHITTARYITWTTLAEATFFLIIVTGGFLTLFGCYIFYRREVAKPLL